MFSFKSVLGNGNYTGQMQYLIALVMCEAIKQVKGVSELDINIKWPNDIYVNKRTKICGIISQSFYGNNGIISYATYHNGDYDLISGAGLNVSNRKPTTCLEEEVKKKTGNVIHISR